MKSVVGQFEWTYDLATSRGVESTPIVVDGVMYVTSAWSILYALDAKTGEELWVHDPAVDRAMAIKACCDVVNRGVAVWDGKIYVGVIDGRLQALDAFTGEVVWSVVTVDQSKPYTITGAPRVVKGNVLIGNGGAELGVRGYLRAYDAARGEKLWSQNAKSGIAWGPGTYAIDGEQFVTVTTGWGSAYALAAGSAYDTPVAPIVGKVVTFKLGGTATIPEPDMVMADRTPKAERFGDKAMLETGLKQYAYNCAVCHGPTAISSGVLPDLRWSAISANAQAWKSIVIDGALASNGMVSFAEKISEADAEAIRAYVVKQAHEGEKLEAELAVELAAAEE